MLEISVSYGSNTLAFCGPKIGLKKKVIKMLSSTLYYITGLSRYHAIHLIFYNSEKLQQF